MKKQWLGLFVLLPALSAGAMEGDDFSLNGYVCNDSKSLSSTPVTCSAQIVFTLNSYSKEKEFMEIVRLGNSDIKNPLSNNQDPIEKANLIQFLFAATSLHCASSIPLDEGKLVLDIIGKDVLLDLKNKIQDLKDSGNKKLISDFSQKFYCYGAATKNLQIFDFSLNYRDRKYYSVNIRALLKELSKLTITTYNLSKDAVLPWTIFEEFMQPTEQLLDTAVKYFKKNTQTDDAIGSALLREYKNQILTIDFSAFTSWDFNWEKGIGVLKPLRSKLPPIVPHINLLINEIEKDAKQASDVLISSD